MLSKDVMRSLLEELFANEGGSGHAAVEQDCDEVIELVPEDQSGAKVLGMQDGDSRSDRTTAISS
jgi:hypothetical protein